MKQGTIFYLYRIFRDVVNFITKLMEGTGKEVAITTKTEIANLEADMTTTIETEENPLEETNRITILKRIQKKKRKTIQKVLQNRLNQPRKQSLKNQRHLLKTHQRKMKILRPKKRKKKMVIKLL